MEAAELVRGQLTVYRECDWYDSLVAPHACLIPDALDDEEDDAEEEEDDEDEDEDEDELLSRMLRAGEVVAVVPGVADVEVAEAPRPSEKEAKVSEKAMKNANTVLPDGTRKQRAKRNACNAFFEHAPAGITVSGRYTKVAEMVSRFGLRIFASR